MDRNINFSISSKVVAAAALGAGIMVGASAAYIITKVKEHSHLTNLITNLHASVTDIKNEITNLENELGYLHRVVPYPEDKKVKKRSRKAVSFSSSTSQSSYKTAFQLQGDVNSVDGKTLTPSNSFTNESEYLTPVEFDDDDEFFDIASTDDEELYSMQLSNSSGSISSDVSSLAQLLKRTDSLIDGTPEQQIGAHDLLMGCSPEFNTNAEVLWRKAKATRNMAAVAQGDGDQEKRIKLINEAFTYAEQALEVTDTSSEVHKWYAILAGARGEFMSTKDRISSGQVFKNHIDIALRISPNDAILHHLLGRFCYEVSLLSWVERTVASTLFADVPKSSFEEALSHFTAAEDLKERPWKENRFFIAKCYFKMADSDSGALWLRMAINVTTKTTDDGIIDDEIRKLAQQHYVDV